MRKTPNAVNSREQGKEGGTKGGMYSLCRLPVAKIHNFWAHFDLLGLLYRPPFTDEDQIWCAIANLQYTLTCQISSRSVYTVTLIGSDTMKLVSS